MRCCVGNQDLMKEVPESPIFIPSLSSPEPDTPESCIDAPIQSHANVGSQLSGVSGSGLLNDGAYIGDSGVSFIKSWFPTADADTEGRRAESVEECRVRISLL